VTKYCLRVEYQSVLRCDFPLEGATFREVMEHAEQIGKEVGNDFDYVVRECCQKDCDSTDCYRKGT